MILPVAWLRDASQPASMPGSFALPSARSRCDEALGRKSRLASSLCPHLWCAPGPAYLLADEANCSLHRLERQMRLQACGRGREEGDCRRTATISGSRPCRRTSWTGRSPPSIRKGSGSPTLPMICRHDILPRRWASARGARTDHPTHVTVSPIRNRITLARCVSSARPFYSAAAVAHNSTSVSIPLSNDRRFVAKYVSSEFVIGPGRSFPLVVFRMRIRPTRSQTLTGDELNSGGPAHRRA